MLASVLIIFIICWAPRVLHNVSSGIMEFSGINPDDFALHPDDMIRLSICLRMFSYVNSIANVFIYYLASK